MEGSHRNYNPGKTFIGLGVRQHAFTAASILADFLRPETLEDHCAPEQESPLNEMEVSEATSAIRRRQELIRVAQLELAALHTRILELE